MSLKLEDLKNLYLIDKVAEIDKFNHQDFADILWRIINDNTVPIDRTPFNVGIFGKWGVGKSTVVNLFKKKLNEWNSNKKNQTKYKFIDFKVWKFSKEALKNKFIFTIGRALNETELAKLTTEIRAKRTYLYSFFNAPHYFYNEVRNFRKNVPWRRVLKGSIYFSIFLILFTLLDKTYRWGLLKTLSDWWVTSLIFLGFQASSIWGFLGNVLKETNLQVTFDKYDTEEQFEEKFIELVQQDSSVKIIFIDDLDRCDEDKVIETLETIKTYLDVVTCIFIIACDDDVVRSIVEQKKGVLCKDKEEGDSSNYLNKFFQYSIRITPFFHQSMIEYAKEILESQQIDLRKIKNLDDILYVLIHPNVKSPRKVISLLNNFASDFELILRRESNNVLNEGDVSNQLQALAVFTVLKTDFPNFYKLIIKDSNLFKYLLSIEEGTQIDSFEEYQKDILKEIYKDLSLPNFWKNFNGQESKSFVDFVKRVDDVIRDIDDINLFIYLNRDHSTSALESERLRTLRNYVKNGNSKEVKEMIAELKKDEEKINHFNVIRLTLNELKFRQEIKKALQCLFDVIESIPTTENSNIKTICREAMAKTVAVASEKAKWVEDFNLGGIFFALQNMEAGSSRRATISLLIDALEKTADKVFGNRILRAIFKYQHLIEESKAAERIKNLLAKRKAIDPNDATISFSLIDICDFIDEFKENNLTLLKFFNMGILEEICDRIIELDKKPELTEQEGVEIIKLKNSFEIIDSVLESTGAIKRRTEILCKLLKTFEYCGKVLDKLDALKEEIPEEMLDQLTSALSGEVQSLEEDWLTHALQILDYITKKISIKPIEGLSSLEQGFYKHITDKEKTQEAKVAQDYLVTFADGRLKDEIINQIVGKLLDEVRISKELEITKRVIDFLLSNKFLLNNNNKQKLSGIMLREIFDIETYTKYPNNEGIDYWKYISFQVITFLDNKDLLLTQNDLKSSVISESQRNITLKQKSVLVELLTQDFESYTQQAQRTFLEVFSPYLKTTSTDNIMWATNILTEMLKRSKAQPEDFQENLIIAVNTAWVNCTDVTTRYKLLEFLLIYKEKVISMGESYKSNLLNGVEDEFGSGKNEALAFKGLKELFAYYSNEKRLKLIGAFLGSSIYFESNLDELLNAMETEFSKLPEATTVEDISTSQKVAFMETFAIGIYIDERAWNFYAKLFNKIKAKLKLDEKKFLAEENIKKIKTLDEAAGITRNRFSLIVNLKGDRVYSDSEIAAMFTHLFSSESAEKVQVGLDCFRIYYPDFNKIPKRDKNSYKVIIEQAVDRINEEPLKSNLLEVAKKL